MSLDWNYFEEKYPLLIASLKNARSAGRLAHAHLLCSANIEYRLEFPRMLAALAACEHPKEDFSPCTCCDTCRIILNGTHPDTYTLAPTSKSRQIQIGESSDDVDTLRWFESLFFLTSMTKSGWKFGIIQEADRLTEQSQNAFLKTLEEPPEKCLFVLATAHPAELLPTIKSRCQTIQMVDNVSRYDFEGLPELVRILNELVFSARKDLVRTENCSGALIAMLNRIEEAAHLTTEEKWASRLKEAEGYLEKGGLTLLEKRIKGEESCEYLRMREIFLSALHTFFAQIFLIVSGAGDVLPNPELMPDPERVVRLSPEEACRMLNASETLLQALRTNANDELALRSFALKVSYP